MRGFCDFEFRNFDFGFDSLLNVIYFLLDVSDKFYQIENNRYICSAMDNKQVEKISKALGDPYRLKIMEMVKSQTDWVQCSCILSEFKLAQSTMSHHMNLLVDAELLIAVKDGRNMQYQVNKDVVAEYVKFMNVFSV